MADHAQPPTGQALTENLTAAACGLLDELTTRFRELERGAEDSLMLILLQRALGNLAQIKKDLVYLRDAPLR
jgi:hypothetical protein